MTTFCHIIKNWQITFQASKLKGNHFLNLLDNELHTIEPLYTKRGPWIKQFGHLNSLCARAMRAITNHASIGEYYLRFFLRESFSCPCRVYPIEIRRHILYEYRRCIKYQNSLRATLSHLVIFLEFNPNAFSFHEDITQQSSPFCLFYTQLFLFLLFPFVVLFFLLFFVSLYVSNYDIATTVCHCAPV